VYYSEQSAGMVATRSQWADPDGDFATLYDRLSRFGVEAETDFTSLFGGFASTDQQLCHFHAGRR
jgi:hypothetical protein